MRTAYMKAHYPNEFMAAVLTSYMTKNDRLIKYIASCNYNGTPVLPPDVNISNADFTPVDDGIRFGRVGFLIFAQAVLHKHSLGCGGTFI